MAQLNLRPLFSVYDLKSLLLFVPSFCTCGTRKFRIAHMLRIDCFISVTFLVPTTTLACLFISSNLTRFNLFKRLLQYSNLSLFFYTVLLIQAFHSIWKLHLIQLTWYHFFIAVLRTLPETHLNVLFKLDLTIIYNYTILRLLRTRAIIYKYFFIRLQV